MNIKKNLRILPVGLVVSAALILYPVSSFADDSKGGSENGPERLISMSVEYPGVEVASGEDVTMNLYFHNRGKEDESLNVRLASIPKGWEAHIKTFKYEVTGISVPAGEDKNLTFEAKPKPGITPASYKFLVDAQSSDGRFNLEQPILIKVSSSVEGAHKGSSIKLSTSYPVLRGPAKGKYEFSVDVQNQLDMDAVFDLFAQAPQDWTVNFKPSYESKYISSLSLKAGQSSTIVLEVNPPLSTAPGEYSILFRVSSEHDKGEITLKLMLTGSYELKLGTATGLLSLDARSGKEASVSIYVKNTGTAPNTNISFMSFKPENWKVEFKPDKIDTLAPGEMKQVDVVLTPNKDALVGDYSVNLEAKGDQQSSSSAEFRVTVKALAVWGWIGILLIVVVLGGLVVMFRFLGRR